MIIWINGSFGVGKTTAAEQLTGQIADSRIFDPEHVGYMLAANFKDRAVTDFQDLPPWRTLVPHALGAVHALTKEIVIAPQTVLVEQYWHELCDGIAERGLELHHVVLDCRDDALRARIDADEDQGPAAWRHEHVAKYTAARPWLIEAAHVVIDTSDLDPNEVVAAISDSLGETVDRPQVNLTSRQRLLLVALAEPTLRNPGKTILLPTDESIMLRFGWTRAVFDRKLDIILQKVGRVKGPGLLGNQDNVGLERRRRLVEYVIETGIITTADLAILGDYPI